jgi:glycine/D-amino acid oxidase-like deaminating enzyme
MIVPVYDYALVTEPLSSGQRASIGWQSRQGLSDTNNQFHYYRMTADGRILWGGYDAVYHWKNGFGKQLETNPEVFGRLAEHFFLNFPQLEGLRFTHAWGGAIDTCSRFTPFWGTTHGGRTAYVLGFTGLGVGSSRFGALVMLDLLDGKSTERTELEMVRTKPIPFPPEPFRSMVINLTRKALDQADRNEGRRNLWLKMLDGLGLGFDS